jgi:hypothetical protein
VLPTRAGNCRMIRKWTIEHKSARAPLRRRVLRDRLKREGAHPHSSAWVRPFSNGAGNARQEAAHVHDGALCVRRRGRTIPRRPRRGSHSTATCGWSAIPGGMATAHLGHPDYGLA